jgi:hypothetical protein
MHYNDVKWVRRRRGGVDHFLEFRAPIVSGGSARLHEGFN